MWERINQDKFNQVQVACNPKLKLIFISVPLDSATSPSHVILGDFSRGLTPLDIRWSLLTFPTAQRSILVTIDDVSDKYTLMFARTNNIYTIDPTTTNDASTSIPTPFIQTHLTRLEDGGEIHHFGMVHLRVKGSGTLSVVPYGLNMVAGEALKSVSMTSTSGTEIPIPNAFVNERMSLKFAVNSIDHWFRLIKVKIGVKVLYRTGPA